jgi:hypothetical protein
MSLPAGSVCAYIQNISVPTVCFKLHRILIHLDKKSFSARACLENKYIFENLFQFLVSQCVSEAYEVEYLQLSDGTGQQKIHTLPKKKSIHTGLNCHSVRCPRHRVLLYILLCAKAQELAGICT